MQLRRKFLLTLLVFKTKSKSQALKTTILATFWLGASFLSSPLLAYSNYVSTMIGGGYALADRKGEDLQTLQNHGLIRLAFDLKMKYPFFWSIDLETFQIHRQEETLLRHHHGQGAGISLGARQQPYGFWLQFCQGGLRSQSKQVEGLEDMAESFRYHSAAFGMSYAIYAREYSAIDIQAVTKIITANRGWKKAYGYKNIQLVSLLFSFTLLDL